MELESRTRRPSWRELFYGPDHPRWMEWKGSGGKAASSLAMHGGAAASDPMIKATEVRRQLQPTRPFDPQTRRMLFVVVARQIK
jgi:hypothetical protein